MKINVGEFPIGNISKRQILEELTGDFGKVFVHLIARLGVRCFRRFTPQCEGRKKITTVTL